MQQEFSHLDFFCFVKTEESHVIVKVSTKDKFHFNLDEAQKTNCVTMSWEDMFGNQNA
jgi:hypothetical protein